MRRRPRLLLWIASLLAALAAVPVLAITDPAVPTASATACTGTTYTVRSGDSWFAIASRLSVSMTALIAANGATTSTIIYPGQVLCVPTTSTPTTTVAPVTTAPSVTLPAGVVVIRQFPVQGLCWFSDSWGAPRSGGRTHEGVDIIAAQGKAIYAADDGVLTKQYIDTPGALAGNGWRLTRADGTYFFYAHLVSFAPGLKVGSSVRAGQIIGYVGQTGAAGTPHLHFEVHPGGGAPVNPTSIVRAVDGCKVTTVPTQPSDTTTTTAPATTAPTTTIPPTTTPSTTTPPTTTPPTTTVPAPSPAAGNGLWEFMAAKTVLDTQAPSGQRLVAGVTRTVSTTDATSPNTSVMLRVVARNADRNGNLVVHRCDAPVPTAATLNFGTDRLNATMSMVVVKNHAFCVTASAGLDVRIDVIAELSSMGVGMNPITTKRAVDTRTTQPVVSGSPLLLSPSSLGAGRGARAVTASITVLSPTGAGSLAIGPCGGTPWIVPYSAADHQLFGGIFRINDAGLCISSTTQVQIIVDVTGVWQGSQPIGAAGPQRLLDSRLTTAITSTTRQVALSLPAGATRAQVTVAAIPGSTLGALLVWNCANAKPTGSVVSTGGAVMSATLSLDVTGGLMCVASTGNLQAIVDLTAIG